MIFNACDASAKEASLVVWGSLHPFRLCSPTAETSDLKSLQYRFESDHSYQF